VAKLVDTNILVYRVDERSPEKQRIAREVLHRGLSFDDLVLPHQVLIEFVAAVTRPRKDLGGAPLLRLDAAQREVEELMWQYRVVYPGEAVLVAALRGASAYGLSWYDAHLWAYAEVNGLSEILSEDFEHGRHYGTVRVVDPFLSAADSVHELPPMYETDDAPA
jgi:predicted nucleic acid-binding protein